MGSSEKFCLRWNDFESNISTSFRELRDDKELFDITLACEDEQIQAHKVILSACSPFFRHVLKRNKHDHPLLYLKGVKFAELQAVLNFMYQGEVNVAQEDLNSFLSVAEELKVKGLTQSNSKPSSPPPAKARSRDPPRASTPPPPKRARISNNIPAVNNKNKSFEDNDIEEILPTPSVKTEQHEPAISAVEHYTAPAEPVIEYGGGGDEYAEYEGGVYEVGYDDSLMEGGTPSADGNKELDELISTMSIKHRDEAGSVFWMCVVCQYRNPSMTNLTNHIERNHLDANYTCPKCQKVFRSRHAIKTHIYRLHDDDPQRCTICDLMLASRKLLRTHCNIEHQAVILKSTKV